MKQIIFALLLTEVGLLANCQPDHQPSNPRPAAAATSKPLQRLVGAWVPWPISRTTGFGLLRIKADSTGTYTAYGDRGPDFQKEQDTTRYFFSEIPLKVRYRPHHSGQALLVPNLEVQVWMQGVRLDYELDGDTLREFDKMGKQGSFVRLHK